MKLPNINLRDLFWLALVIAMGLGWWRDSSSKASQLAIAEKQLATADLNFKQFKSFVIQMGWVPQEVNGRLRITSKFIPGSDLERDLMVESHKLIAESHKLDRDIRAAAKKNRQ